MGIDRIGTRPCPVVRTAWPWLCALALAGARMLAAAQSMPELTLTWQAPDECPGESAVRQRVRSYLPADHRANGAVTARAHVRAARHGYRLELNLLGMDQTGRKALSAATCAPLADAAALLVALALDPRSASIADAAAPPASASPPSDGLQAPDSTPSRAAEVPSDAARDAPAPDPAHAPLAPATPLPESTTPDAEAEAEAAQTTPSAATADFQVVLEPGVGLAFDVGMLPQSPALGLRPHLAIGIGAFRAAAGLAFWFGAEGASDAYPRARVAGRGLLGDLQLGYRIALDPFVIVPSIAGEVGELSITARGITMPGSAGVTWAAAGAGLHNAYRVFGQLALTLDAFALAPFARPHLVVATATGPARVFTSAALTLRCSAGLAYGFD